MASTSMSWRAILLPPVQWPRKVLSFAISVIATEYSCPHFKLTVVKYTVATEVTSPAVDRHYLWIGTIVIVNNGQDIVTRNRLHIAVTTCITCGVTVTLHSALRCSLTRQVSRVKVVNSSNSC